MWYGIFRIIIGIVLKAFFGLKVEGLENLPQKTNFILVANHDSFLDPLAIGVAIPRRIYWIALSDFYNKFGLSWFMRKTGAQPTGKSATGLLKLLNEDKNVGLFPEGARSHDGKIGEFKRGAALLAMKSGRPILPCAIIGAYEAFPRKARFPKFLPIKVKIGKPTFLLKEYDEQIEDIYLQEGIFKIRNAIKEMKDAG